MTRSSRLLELLDILRGYRRPVSAATLATRLGVSQRTLYRDVASLQAMGAPVRGEAGLGYVLEPGFVLPPLMFTLEEIEALALGADYVATHTDPALGAAARSALARIAAVLPAPLRHDLEGAPLLAGPHNGAPQATASPAALRSAIRGEAILDLTYRDAQGRQTQREVWPFAMAYFDNAHILVGWCALRAQFRHFRLDRIVAARMTGARYARRRQVLLREWEVWRVARDALAADRK